MTNKELFTSESVTEGYVDVDKIARKTLKGIGYVKTSQSIEYENCGVF